MPLNVACFVIDNTMATYRILEVKNIDKTYYLLQVRFLFWWKTEQDYGCDMIGTYNYDRTFDTQEEASKFYKLKYISPITNIVEVG